MSQAKDNYTKSLSGDSKDTEFQQLYKSLIYIKELEQSIEELFQALSHAMCMTENNLAGMEKALGVYNKYKDEYKTKSIKDLASPELIKQAEDFTDMIKSGAIKNIHHTIYQDKDYCKSCKYNPYACKGYNYMNRSDCPYYEEEPDTTLTKLCSECINKSNYKENAMDFMTEMKNQIKGKIFSPPQETVMGGGHRVCEKCGATVFGSVECSCIYKDYSTVLERTSANKEVK